MKNKIKSILPWIITALALATLFIPQLRAQVQTFNLYPGDNLTFDILCNSAPTQSPTPTPTNTVTPEPVNTTTPTITPEPAPSDTPTPAPANTPVPTETPIPPSPTPPGESKPFGPFNWPPSDNWSMFTASRLGRTLSQYEDARQRGVTVLAALTGGHSSYTDANGCFSVQMWRNALDRNDLAALQSYVDDGTIGGLYAIDEPHDWGNSCGPTHADIDAICAYAEQQLPGILCGVNSPPSWLAGYDYEHLGFIFTQTNFRRTSDWSVWADEQFAAASWFPGDVWLSINAYTGSPTAAQIQDAGIALCQSQAAGVMMWKWGQPDFTTMPGAHQAMDAIAQACAQH